MGKKIDYVFKVHVLLYQIVDSFVPITTYMYW